MKKVEFITILLLIGIFGACGGPALITFPDDTEASINESEEDVEETSSSTSLEVSFDGQQMNSTSADANTTNISIGIFGNSFSIFVTSARFRNINDLNDEENYFFVEVFLGLFQLSETDEGNTFNIGNGFFGQINIDKQGDGDFNTEHLDVMSGWIKFTDLCLTVGPCHNSGIFEITLEDARGTISGTFDSDELIQSDTDTSIIESQDE